MHVVLVYPEIHMNTGNVIRLAANTGASLHLVEPLGFEMSSAALKRAGLDYHDLADVVVHPNFSVAVASIRNANLPGEGRFFAFSSRAQRSYHEVSYRRDDALVFGAERAGLPESILGDPLFADLLRVPMMPNNRSLNLANTVALTLYEAWRQLNFFGAAAEGEPADGQGLSAEAFQGGPFDS